MIPFVPEIRLERTTPTERSLHEFDLNYEVTWLDSHPSTQTTVMEAVVLSIEQRSMLNDPNRDLTSKNKNKNGTVDYFLTIPSVNGRCTKLMFNQTKLSLCFQQDSKLNTP